jgi:SAM-dependent methyltransferase
MGFYGDFIVPYCIEFCCGMKALVPEREKAAAGLSGTVLEIGFGSGMNLPYYPERVTRVLAVDPSERARRIGRKRIAAARCPVEVVGLDAESIRADAGSADSALSTFTLCTVPSAEQALREVRRILKPGGRLMFVEHGRAPDPKVARSQDRWNGLQRAIAGGCNLNRDIPELLRAAGFRIESLEASYFPGMPRTHGYLYRGAAVAH